MWQKEGQVYNEDDDNRLEKVTIILTRKFGEKKYKKKISKNLKLPTYLFYIFNLT